MTAEEATRITTEALRVDQGKVRVVLDCWYRAIETAARRGRRMVREYAVDRPRTPIPASARESAFVKLRADGFEVRSVADGPNSETIEVCW
jgi:hypothetical protein